MKSLCILRHAKASWEEAVADIDRELKPKGRRQCEKMSAHLAEIWAAPERVLCSPSRRTRDTLLPFLKAWGLDAAGVLFEEGLYLASEADLRARLAALPEEVSRVLLLGHNPGLTDLANALTGPDVYFDNIRPCGVVILEAACSSTSWADLVAGKMQVVHAMRPRELED